MKWEYKVARQPIKKSEDSSNSSIIQEFLNQFGQQGWELVQVDGRKFIFKRQVASTYEDLGPR